MYEAWYFDLYLCGNIIGITLANTTLECWGAANLKTPYFLGCKVVPRHKRQSSRERYPLPIDVKLVSTILSKLQQIQYIQEEIMIAQQCTGYFVPSIPSTSTKMKNAYFELFHTVYDACIWFTFFLCYLLKFRQCHHKWTQNFIGAILLNNTPFRKSYKLHGFQLRVVLGMDIAKSIVENTWSQDMENPGNLSVFIQWRI